MFSFHKPKVYRSTTGCCICKAKSSSSRFTDSKKYESDFIKCFHLKTPRQGEICNACVLLVKRWKKLPPGSTRNWHHVVDARAGPGMKSMTKFKSKHKKAQLEGENVAPSKSPGRKKKHFEREYSPVSDKSDGPPDVEMEVDIDFLSETANSGASSRTDSPGGSDCEENVTLATTSRRHKSQAKRRENSPVVSEFVDLAVWKKIKICCGFIFENCYGEYLVDHRFLKPCSARLRCKSGLTNNSKDNTTTKSYSDSSSDSGYDESSNQGNGDNAAAYSSPEASKPQVSITIDGEVPKEN